MFQKRRIWLIVFSMSLLGTALIGCITLPSAPARSFVTTDLLVDTSLLPIGWEVNGSAATEYEADSFPFRDNLGGSVGNFLNPSTQSGASHEIARFRNAQDATRAYVDHDYTRDTHGQFGETWLPVNNFKYQSSVAEQFRVMCGTFRNSRNVASHCVIEAQYEEFVSIVIYSTLNSEQVVSDLEALAKAVDTQMEHYLKEVNNK